MRFSNPSSRALEKGRLLGSAQIRNSRAWAGKVAATASSSARARGALGQAEDIERPPLGRVLRQVAHGADEAKRRGLVARVEATRDDGAGPAADTRQHRHILMPVRAA